MVRGQDSRWRKLVQEAEDKGWTFARRPGRSHIMAKCPHPCKCLVLLPSSPGEYRAERNTRSLFARCTGW